MAVLAFGDELLVLPDDNYEWRELAAVPAATDAWQLS
jgi:hypothetical protein